MQFELNLMIKTVAKTAKPVNLLHWNAEISQFLWENFTKFIWFFILQVEFHYSGGQGEVGQYKSTPSKGVDISWIHKSEAWL